MGVKNGMGVYVDNGNTITTPCRNGCGKPAAKETVGRTKQNVAKGEDRPYCSMACYQDHRKRTASPTCKYGHDRPWDSKKGKYIQCRFCMALRTLSRKTGIHWEHYIGIVTYPIPAKCEICRRLPKGGKLWLDHCHKTGEFRGWLCPGCNTAIGQFEEDPKILKRARKYLERSYNAQKQ